MTNLRLLQINHVHLPQGLDYLSNELCFMNWYKYPLESLPESFHPNKLIELIMRASSLKQLWNGIKSSMMLKHIDLSYSKDLIMIPDVTEAPNLEKLILQHCTSLSEIHTSLGSLRKLILLNLDGCVCLESLPCKISSESLVIVFHGCLRLKNFPEIVGNMSRLPHLVLAGTAIEGLPLSIKHLTDLTLLNLRDCKSLLSLPDTICCLKCLKTLTLSGCSRLNKLPTNLGNLKCLEKLGVIGIAIRKLPSSVEHLTGLTSLNLSGCKDLLSLPDTICRMTYLKVLNLSGCSTLDRLPKNLGNLTGLKKLDLNETAITELPSSLENLSNLISLNLINCKELLSIPNAVCNMKNIGTVTLSGCSKLEDFLENIGNLIGLEKLEIIRTALRKPRYSVYLSKFYGVQCVRGHALTWPTRIQNPLLLYDFLLVKLELRDCDLVEIPSIIDRLHLLEKLNLSGNFFFCLPQSIIGLSKLKDIYIENCTSLLSLPQIPLSTLSIWANGCTSLQELPNQFKQRNYFEPNVYLLNCIKLVDNQAFSNKFLTMLLRYFQDLCYRDYSGPNRFDLVVPGRKIPQWFSYQCAGASVTLQVPPSFENCLAIGLCTAFEHLPSGLGGLFGRRRHMLVCSIWFYPNGLYRSSAWKECISFPLPEKIDQVVPSHVWLIYLRRQFFHKFIPMFDRTLEIKFELDFLNDYETEGTSYVHSNWWHEIEENGFDHQIDFKTEHAGYVHYIGSHEIEENEFEFKTEGTGFKINKCGVHFVFKQDIEDLSQTNEMDFFSDGEGSFSDEAGPSEEGSFRDCSEGSFSDCSEGSFSDEPGHSGEGSSNVMTGTERIWNLNLIGSLMLRLGNWFRNSWR